VIVCVCRNVSDRAIAASVEAGAQDLAGVARVTGAGSSCGCCVETIAAMLERAAPCKSPPCAGCTRAHGAPRREAA
jgi:bacterioferritin-associated ferredoxin